MKDYLEGEVAVLIPRGPLVDGEESTEFNRVITEHAQLGVRKFLVDLSSVHTTNDTGRSHLIGLHQRCEQIGGMVVFVGLDKRLASIFHIQQLDTVLHLAPDAQAGMALLQAHA